MTLTLFEPVNRGGATTLGEKLIGASNGFNSQTAAMRDIAKSLGRSFAQARGQLQREAALPFSAPKTLFNKPVHAIRTLGVGSAELSRFKTLSKDQGVSINEIALTIIGAALDRY